MTAQSILFPEIEALVSGFNFENISSERKKILQPLIDYIQSKYDENTEVRLNFICTHNSRRSHFSQIWSQAAAAYYDIKNVFCYSGGTEATTLFPTVVKTLENNGLKIMTLSNQNNTVYAVKYAQSAHPVIGFSKVYDNDFNPQSGFAAVMTCSQADEGCPFVAGAEKRIPITFEDPKVYDNTPQNIEMYHRKSLEIATDFFYVFSQIKRK